MIYKNIEELTSDNPGAVKNKDGGYFERPDDGWYSVSNEEGFMGIGYHGNEYGFWKENWETSEAGLGHIPTNGYG